MPQCPNCSYQARDNYNLRRHVASQHGITQQVAVPVAPAPKEKKQYICDQCKQSFAQKFNLDRHVKRLHTAPAKPSRVPIAGYEGLYSIDKQGVVYNDKRGTILSPGIDPNGFKHVNLYLDGKPKTRKVHMLVAEHFS